MEGEAVPDLLIRLGASRLNFLPATAALRCCSSPVSLLFPASARRRSVPPHDLLFGCARVEEEEEDTYRKCVGSAAKQEETRELKHTPFWRYAYGRHSN